MNKERLLDIFSRIEKEDKPTNYHLNSRVLLIDGMNTFLRGFAVVNRVNYYGHEVGGIIGFLKSLGHVIKLLSPTRIVIIFDGEAGSANRKYLYSDYKANRDNVRIMNYKSFSNKTDEDNSKYDQITRLIDYLSYLPVSLISIDKLEADDVIGYLSKIIYQDYDDSEQYILSADNDFLQLINDRVKVYSPIKKKIYHVQDVVNEFNIHPNNFLLFKVLTGDDSDNIPGVSGFGKVNTPKLFETFKGGDKKSLNDLFDICADPPKKSVLYERVLNTRKQVEIFYKIMNLESPNISDEGIENIRNFYYQKPTELRKYDFMKIYNQDRMGNAIPNLDSWLNIFSVLNNYQ